MADFGLRTKPGDSLSAARKSEHWWDAMIRQGWTMISPGGDVFRDEKVIRALGVREAMREYRRGKPVAFQGRRYP